MERVRTHRRGSVTVKLAILAALGLSALPLTNTEIGMKLRSEMIRAAAAVRAVLVPDLFKR